MPRTRKMTPAMRAALSLKVEAPTLAPAPAVARLKAGEWQPQQMTPALAKQLQSEGYHLPDSWPANARAIQQFNSKSGWSVETVGGYEDEPETIYTAPDGTRFCKASNGARVVAVGLSKKVCGLPLRVAPGARRPRWVIESMPKGEIPEALRAYLLRKGEKLSKGEKRAPRKTERALAEQAEAFAVEPATLAKARARGRHGVGIRGVAAQFIGPRPRTGAKSPELREWERSFRKLQKERPEIFSALKAAK